MVFDLTKYQLTEASAIDMRATKRNLVIFLNAYQTARERVNYPRLPKITQSFNLLPPSNNNQRTGEAERLLIQKEEHLEEFQELHNLFVNGYLAISHINPDATLRRRKIFFLRYLQRLTILQTADRLFISESMLKQETRRGTIQFCDAIGLTILKSETESMK